MEKVYCDRCEIEIKKDKEQEFRLEQLWTATDEGVKDNKHWDLCKKCTDKLFKFLDGKLT